MLAQFLTPVILLILATDLVRTLHKLTQPARSGLMGAMLASPVPHLIAAGSFGLVGWAVLGRSWLPGYAGPAMIAMGLIYAGATVLLTGRRDATKNGEARWRGLGAGTPPE